MSTSLLSSTNRIEVPFIKVTIGDFEFGTYKEAYQDKNSSGVYTKKEVTYPNYIQRLNITKINGQVNTYELSLIYPIRPGDDPNFFEKVFSKVSATRKIIFSYGDMSVPDYIYKDEQAIITFVGTQFDLKGGTISYTVKATSCCALGYSGGYTFSQRHEKPSKVIYELITDPKYNIKSLFAGMQNSSLVESLGLIARDDQEVELHAKVNTTVLDYLKYLVDCMIPNSVAKNSKKTTGFYCLTIHDEAENETINGVSLRVLNGPYFKVSHITTNIDHPDALSLDLGYPSSTFITSFSLENNENYSIYYNYQDELTTSDKKYEIDPDSGELEQIVSPNICSQNDHFHMTAYDKVWWTKVTDYPIGASIQIRGLLRPAMLMNYLRLNVYFYGHKHISSGLYIITKQVDTIDKSGYKTTLTLTKIKGESEDELV